MNNFKPSGKQLSDDERARVVATVRTNIKAMAGDDAETWRFCTDATIERFCRLANYEPAKAMEFMKKTIKWRNETKPWAVKCEGCMASANCHSLRMIGMDKEQRPVLYYHYGQSLGRSNAQHNSQHLMRLLEECTKIMDGLSPPVSQWTWVIDFHGYTMWDSNVATVSAAAQFLPMHPFRLFKVILIDAPTLFSGTWSLAQGMLSDMTKEKVQFTPLSGVKELMAPWAGDEVADWILAEANDNRALATSKSTGDLTKMHWQPPSAPGAHDPRGIASYVNGPHFISNKGWADGSEAPPDSMKKSSSWLSWS